MNQDIMSMNDSSPFLLSSPLASSIVLERHISKKHENLELKLRQNSDDFGSDNKCCKSLRSQNNPLTDDKKETRSQHFKF